MQVSISTVVWLKEFTSSEAETEYCKLEGLNGYRERVMVGCKYSKLLSYRLRNL